MTTRPAPPPDRLEEPSMYALKNFDSSPLTSGDSEDAGTTSPGVVSVIKSANVCALIAFLGSNWIPNSPNSITHLTSLPDESGL